MKLYLVLETFCKLKASYLLVFYDLFSTRTRRQTCCDTKGEGRQFYKLYACLSLQFCYLLSFVTTLLLLPTILQKLPYKVKSSFFKRIFQGWSNTPELNTALYTSSLYTCNHYWLSIRRWLTQGLSHYNSCSGCMANYLGSCTWEQKGTEGLHTYLFFPLFSNALKCSTFGACPCKADSKSM